MAHAKGHIREEFCDLLELYVRGETSPAQVDRLHAMTGQLWGCTDTMPNLYRGDVEELVHWTDEASWKHGTGSYAAASRHVRHHIEKGPAVAA